jgi:cell division protein FtsB
MPRRPTAGAAVRWDRVGRVAMLIVLLALVYLYIGAARSFLSTYSQARQRRSDVAQLERANAGLRARAAALHSPSTLEREARQLGMVRPGERAYVIQGLPAN